jgi:hypothetical protein
LRFSDAFYGVSLISIENVAKVKPTRYPRALLHSHGEYLSIAD